MAKDGLVGYIQNKERILFLKREIKNFEDFYSLEQVANIYMEFCNEYYKCKKKNVDMSLINSLELYYANLKYYYRLI
jgi:hypothetical protein